jgi:putative colanic acid biosysnthesis UDP-glucose lipid carrier transferase
MPRDCGIVFTEVPQSLAAGAERLQTSRLKRLIDIFGAAMGLVLLSPFLLLVAIAVLIEHPGPIIFRQRRTGYGGVPFVIYKFRTMTVLEDGHMVVPATRDDGRTTRFGRFLRRTSIDELPQLVNVLKGDMSLVGPRPHALAHDEFFGGTVRGYDDRFLAKPGITGLAQVSGLRGEIRGPSCMAARLDKDLEYVSRWSVGMDIDILFRTLTMGPFHPAAY